MKFELKPYARGVSNEKLLEDLVQVANSLRKDAVSREEYDAHGSYSSDTLRRRFKATWFEVLALAGLKRTRNLGITDEEYFSNLEEVWIKLGHQPRYAEMHKPLSTYGAGAYENRFGSWRKSLEAFTNYVNCEDISRKPKSKELFKNVSAKQEKQTTSHRTKRSVSDRLRFLVMRRDRFTCRNCGKSPATHFPLELVIDHIHAWIKGGETVFDNLQTLCRPCNGGKGDLGQSE